MGQSLQRILVATDFSPQAELAVARAAQLAREQGASLELLHAAPLPLPTPVWGGDLGYGTGIDAAEVVASATRSLGRIAEEVNARFGFKPSLHCEARPVVPLLRERLQALRFDLLVIGATGAGAIARRLFGSNAQSILRHAPVPTLIVRRPAEAGYRRLLAATDFSADAERAARFARALAPSASVSVFAALDLPDTRVEPLLGLSADERRRNLDRAREAAASALSAFAGALGTGESDCHLRDGRASHELPEVAAAIGADLICLGAHGKGRIEAAVLGSTSLHTAAEAGCDVLVVPHAG